MNIYFTIGFRSLLIIFTLFSVCCVDAYSETVIYVDNQNPYASDNNPGTSNRPLKTLSKAAVLADANNKKNVPVKVLVNPGIYRETVTLPFVADHSNTDAPIVFEAATLGTVVIAGSDVWTGWRSDTRSGTYTHNWPYKWGVVPNPWPTEDLKPIVRRREMVFIEGKFVKQVLSINNLTENSFYISESQRKIYVRPRSNVNMNAVTVEVGVRPVLFSINNRKNVTIRGFIFKHANTAVDGCAVEIHNSSDVLAEDNLFIWNNWGGLRINGSSNIIARRNVANHNGGKGMDAWRINGLIFEDNVTSFNNWRGVRGSFTGWAVAGLKHLRIHDALYKNHISVGNKTRGFWCDFDCSDVVIEGAFLANNLKDGIFVEASQGQVTLQDSAICNNGTGPGIIGNNSQNVLIEGSVIYGNGDTQIGIRGVNTSRSVDNWETGEKMNLLSKNWTIMNNVIMGEKSNQSLIDVKDTPADKFINTLSSDENTWYNEHNTNVFKANGTYDFNGWKSITGQDGNSVFGNPDSNNISQGQEEILDICKSESIVTTLSVNTENVTHSSATITWNTEKPSDSRIEHGLDESYGNMSKSDPDMVTYHSVPITNLEPETTYHYRVISEDGSGNSVISGDYTFKTGQYNDNSPPSVPPILTAIVISESQINLSWGASRDNMKVTGYRIYRDGSEIANVKNTYFSDTKLSESTKYTYVVTSLDAAGNESGESVKATATTYAESSMNLESTASEP